MDNWNEKTTTLVMDSLEVTKKVLHCLINGCHIVSPLWLSKIDAREGLTDEWPNEEEYVFLRGFSLPPAIFHRTMQKLGTRIFFFLILQERHCLMDLRSFF